MESAEQNAGEKLVRETLIEPLIRRGLMRPAGMTKDVFEAMKRELEQKLAYMTPTNLGALEEHAATLAGGKEKDRFPIAQRILEAAATIQPPEVSNSPLMISVFRHRLGSDALAQGWAPELLVWIRRNRRWPTAYSLRAVEEEGIASDRRLKALDRKVADGGELTPTEIRWRSARLDVVRRCEAMAFVRDGEAA